MLKLRVITAAVLAPMVIAAILLLPSIYIEFIFVLILMVAAWEWLLLAGMRNRYLMTASILFLLLIIGSVLLFAHERIPLLYGGFAIFGLVWWLGVAAYLFVPKGHHPRKSDVSIFSLLLGLITLTLACATFSALRRYGEWGAYYLLCCLFIVWAADIGAYFSGRRFGRIRLAPRLSPGKTLEGGIGGMLAVIVISLGAAIFFGFERDTAIKFIILSVVTAVFSIIGDLFESLLKRQAGVKDSGALLPGHGGVLDRIDSLLAAVPVFFGGIYGWL